jgi:glutathione synthase/RimK-type ligase-like ATP-grasp enzyme
MKPPPGTPYEEWFLDQGILDLSTAPPEGVFYNRMSASLHSRDHRYAQEFTAGVLDWLEGYDLKIINKSRALQFEVSKIKQHVQLEKFGVTTPKTVATIGKEQIKEAAKGFKGSFITKHNRAGK